MKDVISLFELNGEESISQLQDLYFNFIDLGYSPTLLKTQLGRWIYYLTPIDIQIIR